MDSTPCSVKLKFVCKRTDKYFKNQDQLEKEGSKKLTKKEFQNILRESLDRLIDKPNFMLGNGRNIQRGRFLVAVPIGGFG